MWFTFKRFINNNAEYLAETLLYLLLAYLVTLVLHRIIVGPFTSETERRHGETTGQYEVRYSRMIEDPGFHRRRRWRRIRATFVWLAFLFGAVPWILMRGSLIY